jgi:phosphate transport system protein
MTTDLERIGDKARKIARLSAPIRSSTVADEEWLRDVKDLAARASTLVREALNTFVRGEIDGAVGVIRQAQAIGRQSNAVSNLLILRMSEQPGEIAVLLDMLSVVRAVDRVADHAGNLAEHLIYIVHGTDVRHATLDQIEREALQR